MMSVPTPHISSQITDFAKTVLMPGDPLRAKFIADNFLSDAVLVNNVRGIGGYTGFFEGTKISVMASGMGMPSMGIYSYELFNFYDVDNIIRIGSAGAISNSLKVRDIVAGMSACTNSNFASQYKLPGSFAPTASYKLLSTAAHCAKDCNMDLKVGSILSSDTFYDNSSSLIEWQKMGVLAVEMEAAALYMNAARAGKNALAICTISDCPFTGASCSHEERQTSFTQMMEIALKTAVALEK
ncbi:MAG: purine-nucleoside phosphorylase [Clostridia bacterium]|nr:purine-nucleoside phosphorylase [Clostridia bacterium]